ncbi:pyridine nucleotide-disulfide oxidoreductase domain-containing protein 1 isoform X2 [Parasteatoda tepidariorum]|uniref:pyridine nucleotide-disulfide oxidoreductase domain-containing protein 1 isoform X2 n=1 Tax=Parasteatoda tepidariorum TaxID=114398 RepID=UPI001C71B57E|nr:pyridine nucleotide-disulfide oxidoreductase domain-containing protein 1 isoform X2 [Parasteatoda tepidariorum]
MAECDTADICRLSSATFIIIGGGIAGVSCAEQLAFEQPDESIILISASPFVKVAKNVIKISKRLEDFDVGEESYSFLENRHANCTVYFASAVEIDSLKHIISRSNPYILGIRDTETVEVFQRKLLDASRVIVVGNGGLAIEIVYEIENCDIIWAIKDKSVGSTFFDAGAAKFFLPCLNESKQKETAPSKRLKYTLEGNPQSSVMGSALGPDWSTKINMKGKTLEKRNVHVEYECEVKNIHSRDEFLQQDLKEITFQTSKSKNIWPVYVELTNGSVFGCDFVISATGVIPNTSLLLKNELLIADDGGIAVNDQMKTNLEDIFAAGDACTASWSLSEHWFQMRLWTQARQMGAYAAKCMSSELQGETAVLDICFDLFTHVTKFFGYKVVLLGLYNGQKLGNDYEIIVRTSERREYAKVVMKNGRMQGAVLIGETDLEETFENLILNSLDLTPYGEDILNPDVDIEDYFD